MLCTHCSKTFLADAVKSQRGKGLNAQIQCPHCQAWLGRNPTLSILKMCGFYLAVLMLVVGYFLPDWRGVTIPVAILAVMTLLVSHMMDHLKVTEAPEIETVDDSEHRRKYR
ncbi:hypothetical protein LZP69_11765 [Shewanella sp. AS1]|uniref:hypothetical protein n=1 Tax=Shewanella sp. AS1 TaxID=2907626 RepID=UPI001F16E21D|nr:hypothetical protein [Shewanella sp. AS1]MCE9679839.1 hypothetical protein [Shewanella sp. AS1]